MVLVLVEHGGGEPDELSLQALAFARTLGEPVEAVLVAGEEAARKLEVPLAYNADISGSYAPGGWAAAVTELVDRRSPSAVIAGGSEVGNEVLAHVAARLDLPFAANCVEATPGDPLLVTRARWGGSLLEEARVHGRPALLTVFPHAVAAAATGTAEKVETFAPAMTEADLSVRVSEQVAAATGGISLADAKVVVSGGRGVGSAEAFAIIEELAELLHGAVGCSRVVTSAGWRPHTDQVGQTGTKISPDLYIACGISGATQHIAGCRGAKKLLAINSDPEAPILASADYAVIGDLHEVVPAISGELRKTRAP
jgi:electron transfer flavoprotein alpha subunit